MSGLVEKPETVNKLIDFLDQKANEGNQWVVYDTDNPIGSAYELDCFFEEIDAIDHAMEYQQIFNWHEAVPIGNLLYELKQLQRVWLLHPNENGNSHSDLSLKTNHIMNLNNLENLKKEMQKLGFGDAHIAKMEEHMRKDEPFFKLHDTVKGTRGQVDITLQFKQSGQSDYYYLNRLEAAHNLAKHLEEGQKYIIITHTPEGQDNGVKKMENLNEAISYFKKQSGNVELAVGKSAASKTMLANMENGKINYVARDFERTFKSPPMPQTFWLNHGEGFGREHAANLVQGRSVYREDLLNRDGVPYNAWVQLDTDKARDRNDNLTMRHFTDAYGYDVKAQLNDYRIKEMEDPKTAQKLENALLNGNRPLITVFKDGQESKMFLETAVRYGKLNFYREDGKPEKREQFLKETGLEVSNSFSKKIEQGKEKDVAQGQGMTM
jgi:hypothetical protein